MALDPAPIARLAAKFIDELEEEYGEEAELVTFCVIAELDLPEDRNAVHIEGPPGVPITARVGLVARALDVVLMGDE